MKLLSLDDLVDRTGISKNRWYELIRAGDLPASNLGCGTQRMRLFVREDDLEAWVEKRRVKTEKPKRRRKLAKREPVEHIQ